MKVPSKNVSTLRTGLEKQPLPVQAEVLSTIIRKITVQDERIVLEVYGSEIEGLVTQGPKSETPAGEQPVGGSYRNKNGRGGPIVVEPLVVVSEHPAQWVRPEIDLEELGRLRQEGVTIPELMARYQVSKTTLKAKLRRVKK